MTKVTAEMVKELRERTGVGMGKCKEALDHAKGDMDLAIEYLRKTGMASAVKKEGRETNEGLIGIGESSHAMALVEINSETDFVAQNEKFKQFLRDMAQEAAELKKEALTAFLGAKCKMDPTLTIDQYRALIVQSLGENIKIRRILILPKSKDISIGIYSHMNGKIVSVVELSGGQGHENLARDIAMHIAAESPDYLQPSDVPTAVIQKEEEIAKSQVQGKPAAVLDKIVQGKIKAFYDQVCLVSQKYVKDNSTTVAGFLEKESKRLGKTLHVRRFIRWQVGEAL